MKILNAAPATPNLDKELLKFTTILCVNESEASLLVGNPVNSLRYFYYMDSTKINK